MSNIGILVGLPIGLILFLFFIWKRFKEDYTSERVFSIGFIISGFLIAGFSIGAILGLKASSSHIFNIGGLWFWTSFFGLVAGFIYVLYLFKISHFFEFLETIGIGFLFWLLPFYLVGGVIFFVVTTFLIFLFYFLSSRYKSFSWYKSGRVGLAGVITLGLFFMIRLVVALLGFDVLSFVGKFDAILDVLIVFGLFVAFFKLSEV